MKLTDLNPSWVGYGGEGMMMNSQPIPRRERTAIEFDCPCGCDHRVCIPFANPEDGQGPVYSGLGWQRTGETFDDLTLTPSIQRELPARCWHGYVTNGEVSTCPSQT
jgi:hypothetical protein